jgi:hypothetical protein
MLRAGRLDINMPTRKKHTPKVVRKLPTQKRNTQRSRTDGRPLIRHTSCQS